MHTVRLFRHKRRLFLTYGRPFEDVPDLQFIRARPEGAITMTIEPFYLGCLLVDLTRSVTDLAEEARSREVDDVSTEAAMQADRLKYCQRKCAWMKVSAQYLA